MKRAIIPILKSSPHLLDSGGQNPDGHSLLFSAILPMTSLHQPQNAIKEQVPFFVKRNCKGTPASAFNLDTSYSQHCV